MSSEMDVMKMDGRQRASWMQANRITLMIVGLVWIGLIGWDVVVNRHTPWFMIAMVPAFAALRAGLYAFFNRER